MRDRIRHLTLVFVLGASLLVSSAPIEPSAQQALPQAVPQDAQTVPLDQEMPVEPDVTVGELANGLRYFIRENQEPENRAELRLIVRVGPIVEDDEQLGVAHFLEHMAFNGTENSEYIATAFQIMEDWAHELTLDPEEVDQERGVVIEEWRLGQRAAARLRDRQFPVIFRESLYAERLPIGTVESLENFDGESLRRFYHDWYRPDLWGPLPLRPTGYDGIGPSAALPLLDR